MGSALNFVLQPWQLLLTIPAGWRHSRQQQVIESLRTENQILSETLGKRRIVLTDDPRRRLAVKGKILGRRLLETIGTLVTPDALLRWRRLLVALNGKRYILVDRDAQFSAAYRDILADAGITPVRAAPIAKSQCSPGTVSPPSRLGAGNGSFHRLRYGLICGRVGTDDAIFRNQMCQKPPKHGSCRLWTEGYSELISDYPGAPSSHFVAQNVFWRFRPPVLPRNSA
jgi:hypothetical protein